MNRSQSKQQAINDALALDNEERTIRIGSTRVINEVDEQAEEDAKLIKDLCEIQEAAIRYDYYDDIERDIRDGFDMELF